MIVELRHLRYFLAVAEELSFTRAANRLYIGQPTLSQQIRALEKSIGGPLFYREQAGVRLTAAGVALLAPARRALAGVQDAIQAGRDATAVPETVLRIGLCYAAGTITEPVLGAYRTLFPRVRLAFRELTRPAVCDDLTDDRVDVAITRLPLDPERLAWHTLRREPRILGVAAGHPLADAAEVHVEEILHLRMPRLGPPDDVGVCAYWRLDDYRNGEPPPLTGDPVSTVLEVAHTVAYGESIAVGVPSLRRFLGIAGRALRPVALRGVSDSEVVVARRRTDRRPAVLAFCDTAAEVAGRLRALDQPPVVSVAAG
jgi:DNA-binding transcriptional LysR family regulator